MKLKRIRDEKVEMCLQFMNALFVSIQYAGGHLDVFKFDIILRYWNVIDHGYSLIVKLLIGECHRTTFIVKIGWYVACARREINRYLCQSYLRYVM